jgi:hypothetical protein
MVTQLAEHVDVPHLNFLQAHHLNPTLRIFTHLQTLSSIEKIKDFTAIDFIACHVEGERPEFWKCSDDAKDVCSGS